MTREQPELVAAFIHRLHQNGVRLEVLGEPGRERLRVRAPEGRLSTDDRRRLAHWKDAIVAVLLAEGAGTGAGMDTDGAPPVDTTTAAATTTVADGKPVRKIGFIGKIPPLSPGAEGEGPCLRCRTLEAQAVEVLEGLRAHAALPPALRGLPPEKLAILLKWSILTATHPRPAWPPPRLTDAKRKHRRPLDAIVEDLGGRPAGAEPPPLEELDDGVFDITD
jgi:hypothetical protein